ncbi:hypothetical protein [Polaromonas sp. CG9_12]|nr:hypothetical protein [Polaromonas sp. CG9_12]
MQARHHEAGSWQRLRPATVGADSDGQVCIEPLYRRGSAATAAKACRKIRGFPLITTAQRKPACIKSLAMV